MSLSYDEIYNLDNKLGPLAAHKAALGTKIGVARAEFSATSGKDVAAYDLNMLLPAGCVVKNVYYKVLTTFTSATDAGTIALRLLGANDLVSAVAISNGGNPWDAAALPVQSLVSSLATALVTTAETRLVATVAVEALTAGKLVVFAEYVYHGDVKAT